MHKIQTPRALREALGERPGREFGNAVGVVHGPQGAQSAERERRAVEVGGDDRRQPAQVGGAEFHRVAVEGAQHQRGGLA
ncbi:hypothetical protein RZS08_65985, partial [Arthrospira platensis SPKY1]|nr:hypothetical protein [Arthrospira platensis SPKY1]